MCRSKPQVHSVLPESWLSLAMHTQVKTRFVVGQMPPPHIIKLSPEQCLKGTPSPGNLGH